jgi:CRISPR-associated protein Cmr1
MFLAGADGQTPELRPPSIKGAMRFWWRAVNGHLSLAELKRQEAEIFGNQEKRSKVEVVVEYDEKEMKKGKARPLPHSETKKFELQAIMPGSKFNVILNSNDDKKLKTSANIFILLSFLGGLGKRSRRGFGSFKIKKIIYANSSQESNIEYTTKKLFEELNNVCLDNQKFNLQNNKIVSNDFSGNWSWIEEICLGKRNEDYNSLLKEIGNGTHNNNNYSLGIAENGWRFASPVYVSVIKNNEYQIVITKLKIPNLKNNSITILNSKKESKTFKLDFNKQEKFIKELLK